MELHEEMYATEYDGYLVTKSGGIYNSKINRFLKQSVTSYGYLCVGLLINGNWKTFQSHRLIAKALVENPDNKPHVNHIDGNKQNNHYTNLEWCTNKENINHAWKLGLNTAEKVLNDYMLNKRVKVIDNSTGIIYNSIGEASRDRNVNRHTLLSMISGKSKNKTTLTYYKPLDKTK